MPVSARIDSSRIWAISIWACAARTSNSKLRSASSMRSSARFNSSCAVSRFRSSPSISSSATMAPSSTKSLRLKKTVRTRPLARKKSSSSTTGEIRPLNSSSSTISPRCTLYVGFTGTIAVGIGVGVATLSAARSLREVVGSKEHPLNTKPINIKSGNLENLRTRKTFSPQYE